MKEGCLSFKQWQRLAKFLCLLFVCCFVVISCGQLQPLQTPKTKGDRITIGTTLKPRTLDPADAYELASLGITYNLSDRLYVYEPNKPVLKPQLATALPKVSQDGLTYTIPLRKGVFFHDGTPFNAEAMVFSLRRFMENGGKPSFLLSDIVQSVKVTGEYELTIQLKKPFAAFPALLAFAGVCPVSPKVYEIGTGKFKPDTFVGTGPYKLVKFSSDTVRLDVFEQYWGEKPVNKGIDIQILTSSANLYNSLRSGAVDVAYLSLDPDQIRSLKEESPKSGIQVVETQGNVVTLWVLNVKSKPLDNPKVRQAIAALVDRNLLTKRALQGQAQPLYSLVPPSFDVYKPAYKEIYGDGNSAKAKTLLQQAGYSPTNPAKIQIWYPSSSPTRALVAQTLKALAEQQLGGALQFEVNSVEAATAYKQIPKGVYPTFLMDWYPDFLDPDNYVQPFLECVKGSPAGCERGGSQALGSFYWNEGVNSAIARQRKEQNPQIRKAIFAEIQEQAARDVPYVPLYQYKDYAFAAKDISGVNIEPTQFLTFPTLRKS
ncbi:MAG: ABC transporter substrate-binding protein [Oscillatoriaceae bacterium SKW80]|nr:ABC transporter substrate-binding protein [Oscillatoriaceae bacterium SKYG93]MCX8120287.1 ABC transporter substrate-binding protein [Oscillatoriaceae bacterium SKW80]MDW8453212.1 ABC transporter substrate-binding protein [Oscillatoriaceae cyanobacterium SKYGB_i_bin93]HIK28876.1 peptide ABC transporter substrate-binding protein [Oscillatoriaceae cyanobacterium M7585_C2015_266]